MAKAKPIKQKKENKFLKKVIFFLKTLFSNEACIEGREHKWYAPVIVAILAAIIAVIPTFTGRMTLQASSFFTSGYTYDYENALKAFADQTSSVSMKISAGELSVDETSWKEACVSSMAETPLKDNAESLNFWGYFYKVPVTVTSKTSDDKTTVTTTKDKWYCGLAVYLSGDEDAVTFANAKLKSYITDPNYQIDIATSSDATSTISAFQTNIVVFGKTSFYMLKGVNGTSAAKGSVYAKYDSASFEGKDFHDIVKPAEEQTIANAWGNFLNEGYSSTRISLAFSYAGIMLGISVGIIFLMGLLVFIMTRGKNNPFRIYTFWECQKIAYYASMSPAILSLLAFIPMFSQMTMFLFPMLFILRTTWMSMRSLRPVQN